MIPIFSLRKFVSLALVAASISQAMAWPPAAGRPAQRILEEVFRQTALSSSTDVSPLRPFIKAPRLAFISAAMVVLMAGGLGVWMHHRTNIEHSKKVLQVLQAPINKSPVTKHLDPTQDELVAIAQAANLPRIVDDLFDRHYIPEELRITRADLHQAVDKLLDMLDHVPIDYLPEKSGPIFQIDLQGRSYQVRFSQMAVLRTTPSIFIHEAVHLLAIQRDLEDVTDKAGMIVVNGLAPSYEIQGFISKETTSMRALSFVIKPPNWKRLWKSYPNVAKFREGYWTPVALARNPSLWSPAWTYLRGKVSIEFPAYYVGAAALHLSLTQQGVDPVAFAFREVAQQAQHVPGSLSAQSYIDDYDHGVPIQNSEIINAVYNYRVLTTFRPGRITADLKNFLVPLTIAGSPYKLIVLGLAQGDPLRGGFDRGLRNFMGESAHEPVYHARFMTWLLKGLAIPFLPVDLPAAPPHARRTSQRPLLVAG